VSTTDGWREWPDKRLERDPASMTNLRLCPDGQEAAPLIPANPTVLLAPSGACGDGSWPAGSGPASTADARRAAE
jgi:hypothetical protein